MSRFVVKFMKHVLGENGREAEICQSTLEVDASNEGQATELAKRKFCESAGAPRLVAACRPDPCQGGRFSVLTIRSYAPQWLAAVSAASSTAARHSRFTGRIGGIGASSGSAVGAAIESMFSVREALRMKRL